MKLPVFKIKLKASDESKQEVNYVALTDNPAIEMEWFAFDKNYKFSTDEKRQILTGVAMVADMPIYRKGVVPGTDQQGEYYVVFDKEAIETSVMKFFRNKYTANFNFKHKSNQRTEQDDVYLFESIVVDPSRGVHAPEMFKGINPGSWIISVKVESKETWDRIKSDGLMGFSVEGIFGLEYMATEDEKILQAIADMTKG